MKNRYLSINPIKLQQTGVYFHGISKSHFSTRLICPIGLKLILKKPGIATELISQKSQYKDIYTGRIEIPQRTHNFQVNCCLKVHNAP